MVTRSRIDQQFKRNPLSSTIKCHVKYMTRTFATDAPKLEGNTFVETQNLTVHFSYFLYSNM